MAQETFRSGNTAASLKLRVSGCAGWWSAPFPQWKHCGLIEAIISRVLLFRHPLFPQWKHCGLIEACIGHTPPLVLLFFPQWKHCGLIEASHEYKIFALSPVPFRSGNTAASLKRFEAPKAPDLSVVFPQWKHCGLIEAWRWRKPMPEKAKVFPQWKHCG